MRKIFTLIELLVVVSVIAILISLLLPLLGRAKEMAYATFCLNNVRQCMLGISSYGNDFNGMLTTCENYSTHTGAGYGAWARLMTTGTSYLPPKVVYCPLLRSEETDLMRTETYGIMAAQNGWTWAWLKNEKIQNLFGDEVYYNRDPHFGYNLARIRNASRFPLLADTCSIDAATGKKTGNRQFCPGTDQGDYKVSLHHLSSAVCGFPDGHAERRERAYFQSMQFRAVLLQFQVVIFP